MTEQIEGQMSIFDYLNQDSCCGKTCPEPSQVTVEQTSKPSLRKPQKWQKGMPAFLDLRNGLQVDASWGMGGALLGEYTMRSFGECPNEEKGSLLSQILEVQAHPKYYLSAKACLGILRRAERRGKELPEILKKALIRQAKWGVTYCLQGNGIDRADTAGCNGRGWCKNQSYTLNTIDRPAIMTMQAIGEYKAGDGVAVGVHGDIAGTIDSNYYKGCGERQGTERDVVCVGNGQMCNITMAQIANTLDTMHDQQAILAIDRAAFNQKGPGGGY